MTTVLIAPDKFKGSLTAAQVAEAVSAGVSRVSDATIIRIPVADGGDGTVDAAVAAGYTRVPVTASGPTGQPVATSYARKGDRAVIEMADVCGLVRLPDRRRQPMTATSRGLGEVMAAALDAGCTELVIGVGGSASTDGGAGMAAALGAALLDSRGEPVDDGGSSLAQVAGLDVSDLRVRLHGIAVTVACDVDNPLLGPAGAAAVYGPQKGASPQQVTELDAALTHWADVVETVSGATHRYLPGAGAAGGVGFGAVSLLEATIASGTDLLLELVGFTTAVQQLSPSDLVITGEGSLDEQTLHGKAPAGVAAAAVRHGVPVVAVCGQNTLDQARLDAAGVEATYALVDIEPSRQRCFEAAASLLQRVGAQVAAEYLMPHTGAHRQADHPERAADVTDGSSAAGTPAPSEPHR